MLWIALALWIGFLLGVLVVALCALARPELHIVSPALPPANPTPPSQRRPGVRATHITDV